MTSILFFILLLSCIVIDAFGFFFGKSKTTNKFSSDKKDCCLKPKVNINIDKANLGSEFLRQLTINSDFSPDVTPKSLCYLMHFLFQQASINNKPYTVHDEMFVIFDSSNQVFDRIVRGTKLRSKSRLIGRRSLDPDEKFPIYGVDIPQKCLPSGFLNILVGELPPVVEDFKYGGKRMFIKPGRFGFEKTSKLAAIKHLRPFITQYTNQKLCQIIQSETKSECTKLQILKDNTDQILFKKWKKVLGRLPAKWNVAGRNKERAYIHGIREMDQQSRDLLAANGNRHVRSFRTNLIKHYGQDDIRVRKGREIIFTTTDLKQAPKTCISDKIKQCKF